MPHPNETRLRELYVIFATGNVPAFLEGCTEDSVFDVPGNAFPSGHKTKAEFTDWIMGVIGRTAGTFREDVLDVFANDEHGVLLLQHGFDRDGKHWEYGTAHVIGFRDGMITSWREHPGSLAEFEAAWGAK